MPEPRFSADGPAQTSASHELLKAFDVIYRDLKRRKRLYRFDDIPRLLVGRAGAITELYYRLDASVHHLLVDEFQDTSLAQWRVLKPMAQEIVAHGDGERSFFCVGDVKQAIYGWRGGEAAIFDALDRSLGGAIQWDRLDESYRSSPVITTTVNAVFETMDQNPVMSDHRESAAAWLSDFRPHRTAERLRTAPGYAELRVGRSAEDGPSQRRAILCDAADLVAELHRDAPGRTIGVLVRTNQAVARMIFELRRAPRQVPASEEGGNPLTDASGVSVVLSLLRLADHPDDTNSRFHVARSPLGPHVGLIDHANDEAARTLGAEIRRSLLDRGYGPVIMNWAHVLAASCDQRDLRRLLQLAEMAYAHEAHSTLRPGEFVRHVQHLRVEDPSSADVRVMTFHQAKGLEFDAVVLPELGMRLTPWQPPPEALVDRPEIDGAIRHVSRYLKKEWWDEMPPLRAMADRHAQRHLSETLSGLYVAMTRAAHALYMLIPPSKANEKNMPATWAGLLRGALTDGAVLNESQTVWRAPGSNQRWYDDLPKCESMEVEDAVIPRPIQLGPPISGRHLVRRSASAEEGMGLVDPADCFDITRSSSRLNGTAMHALFERIQWLEAGLPDRSVYLQALASLGLSETDRDRLIERFERSIEQPVMADLLSRRSYEAEGLELELRCEESYAWSNVDRLENGILDRLVLGRRAGHTVMAHVIDFKTDAYGESAVDHYRPQLEHYRAAVSHLFDLKPESIRTTLVFVYAGVICDV